jgi:cobalt/nickel transport system permease protein
VFAVHIPDGALQPTWLFAGGCGAFALLWVALFRLDDRVIPRLGLLTSALFVASLIHVPVGVGKVHLLLNAVAGILLGRRVTIAIFVALLFQAFLFAHGGITTLGVNTLVLALPALLGGVSFRQLVRRYPKRAYLLGTLTGLFVSVLTVSLNAGVNGLGLETRSPEVTVTILIVNTPVIVAEAVLTGIIVRFLAKVKPEWILEGGTQRTA